MAMIKHQITKNTLHYIFAGEFVYIRDDRDEEDYLGLCEVQVV